MPESPMPAAGLTPTKSPSVGRYLLLYLSFARYCLVRELTFRANFLVRCVSGLVWVLLVLGFFELIFLKTEHIGAWNKYEYLFFMGTSFIINALVQVFFLENCSNFTELIRTGNLDFALLKPIDEQFLLTTQRMDWSEAPDLVVGFILLGYSMRELGMTPTLQGTFIYFLLIVAGVAILYSMMVAMATSSIWLVGHSALYELWFYVTQFARYPADIYGGNLLGRGIYILLMFVLPVMLAVNTPALFGVKTLSWPLAIYLFVAAGLCLTLSRWFFRYSLTRYRSASS